VNQPGFKTDQNAILGGQIQIDKKDFGDTNFSDHKIAFAVQHCTGKDVLDVGCVHHDPEAYRSRYWVHKALRAKARTVVGLDLSREGVDYLNERGFELIHADAQNFELKRNFDVIFAGDIIEHLEDFSGFLESCKRHLRTDGSLLISTPNPWYWRYIAQAIMRHEVNNNPEHTCWLDPRTLRQLVRRHGMDVVSFHHGSRYARDRLMPLPKGIKHASWHAVVKVT